MERQKGEMQDWRAPKETGKGSAPLLSPHHHLHHYSNHPSIWPGLFLSLSLYIVCSYTMASEGTNNFWHCEDHSHGVTLIIWQRFIWYYCIAKHIGVFTLTASRYQCSHWWKAMKSTGEHYKLRPCIGRIAALNLTQLVKKSSKAVFRMPGISVTLPNHTDIQHNPSTTSQSRVS